MRKSSLASEHAVRAVARRGVSCYRLGLGLVWIGFLLGILGALIGPNVLLAETTDSLDQQRPRKLLKGDQALLYTTINEHEQNVDMAPLIDGRPLVLVVGSAT